MTTTIHDVISQLRQPVSSLELLEDILHAPLVSLRISSKSTGSLRLATPPSTRQLATLQTTILAHVYPTWGDQTRLSDSYFVPPKSGLNGPASEGTRALVLGSLMVLSTPPLSNFAVLLLEKLVRTYSLDEISDIAAIEEKEGHIIWDRMLSVWMSIPGKVANALFGSGTSKGQDVPDALSFEEFGTQTCLASERIVWGAAREKHLELPPESDIQRLTHLVSKLISTGHFSESAPSFIPLTLPKIYVRLASTDGQAYAGIWSQITKNLPGPQLQTFTASLLNHLECDESRQFMGLSTPVSLHPSKILHALLCPASETPLEVWSVMIESGRTWSRRIVRCIIGWAAGLDEKSREADEKGLVLMLEHVLARWSDPQYVARALLSEHRYLTSLLVLTLGALSSLSANHAASLQEPSSTSLSDIPLSDLNDAPSSPPTSPTTIPRKTLPVHPLITSTSTSPRFLQAVRAYLSQPDQAVRRCGMLVAEIVASGKLDFEDWDGEEEWQKWAKGLRAEARDPLGTIWNEMDKLGTEEPQQPNEPIPPDHAEKPDPTLVLERKDEPIEDRQVPPEPDSDDDSLVGYASPSPASSRAPSPTPSELADPTLRRRSIARPVYLAELGALLVEAPKNAVEVQPSEQFGGGAKRGRRGMGITGGRGGGDAEDTKGRVEMALEVGAELIRRKRGYGSELDENAKDLAYLFLGLQDNFDLDQFEEKRQSVLVALVVCAPTKAAPTIIEQFFHHQYSTAQRFTMLNALAIGARELAGLPLPPSRDTAGDKKPRIDFPSKVLPGQAHLEYITEGDLPPLSPGQGVASQRRIERARDQVSAIVEDLSGRAITRSRQDTEASVPQVVRERALKVGPRPGRGIVPIESSGSSSVPPAPVAIGYLTPHTPLVPFARVAAEYFVAPLINRFWVHLRGSLEREAYGNAAQLATGARTGTGTGLILSPL
ncbi:telomere binding protein, partial [Ceratobasidium sp. 370]